MIDYTAKPNQTDQRARTNIAWTATPIANQFHGSVYSQWSITLPSGTVDRFVLPLEAAVAIEELGYKVELTGRFNG